ncbi:hypothetical protein ACM66B_004349 [Microbotryomycetes sp. NB124-2]
MHHDVASQAWVTSTLADIVPGDQRSMDSIGKLIQARQSSASESAFDLRLRVGPLLWGTWLSIALLMLTLHHAWIYFRHYRSPDGRNTRDAEGGPRYVSRSGSSSHDHDRATHHDPLWLRIVVTVLIAICSLGVLNNMILCWLYTVTHFGDFVYLQSQPWPFVVFGVLTGLSGCMVQMFLLTRLWKLMRSYFVAALIVALSFTSYGSGLWSCWILVNNSRYDQRDTVRVSISLWLTLSAATDIVLAGLLLWRLVKARQETLQFSQSTMSEPLKKLIVLIIESGAAIAVVQTAGYVFFRIFESSNIPTALAMCLPSVYTLTLLFNLNIRQTLRRAMFKRQLDVSANVAKHDTGEKAVPPYGHRSGSSRVNTSSHQRMSVASAILVSRTESQVIEHDDDFPVDESGATLSRLSPSEPVVVPLQSLASGGFDAKTPDELV